MHRRTLSLVALAATLSLSAGAACGAAPADVATSKRVSLAGLNLENPRDAATAYRRLVRASRDVCTYASAPQQYSSACAERALAESVERVGAPAVEAAHRNRRG